MKKICSTRGCKEKSYGKGKCRNHYLKLPDVAARRKKYSRKYYLRNKEKIKDTARKYAKDNKEKRRALMAAWYQKNKERLAKRYQKNKKEISRKYFEKKKAS